MEDEADAKVPLNESTDLSGVAEKPVDYDAIFGKSEHREEFAKETVLGECRNPKRVTWVEWLFMSVATLSMLGVLALSIERLVFFEQQFDNLTLSDLGLNNETTYCNSWICTSDFIFAIALLVNLGFCAFYCYDGLFRERPFEILAYAAAVTVIVVYIIANFAVKGDEDQPLRLVRLIFVVIFGPINVFLALGSWWKMGYFVLNVIGTNKTLVRAYRFRSFFQTLQLFNIEVLCNILVLAWFKDGQLLELWEKIIVFLLLFFSAVVTIIGGIAIIWEVHILSYMWYVLTLPCGLYYLYKFIEVAVNFQEYRIEYTECISGECVTSSSVYVAAALIFACIFGLFVVVLLVIFMALSQWNFGKGLIYKVHPPLHRYVRKFSANRDSYDAVG